MRKRHRWLWGLVLLLAFAVVGCAGATPVTFAKSLIRTADSASPSKTFIRIKLPDVAGTDNSGFTIQETVPLQPGYKPIALVLKAGGSADAGSRLYVAKEGYRCRDPIQ